jgi:benzoylformate decarboxylase
VVKLAELLGAPVAQDQSWGADFPNFHPLGLGLLRDGVRYPKNVDCFFNIGGVFPAAERVSRSAKILHASVDSQAIGRNTSLNVALLGNVKQSIQQLTEAVENMATPQHKARAEARRAECAAFTKGVREGRLSVAKSTSGSPVPWYRALAELNELAERDAVIVPEIALDEHVLNFFPFADDAKLKIGRTTGMALGWGVGASAGVKLALPDRQVIAIQGDGSFLFGQTDSLWTMSRYSIPVLIVVLNNRSYEATRWRVMARGTPAGVAGRDYISYLGDPDVEFTQLAAAYNIRGEVVNNTDQLRPAIQKAFKALADGRPYLLDVRTRNSGAGAEVSWYPKFSVADQRTRNV